MRSRRPRTMGGRRKRAMRTQRPGPPRRPPLNGRLPCPPSGRWADLGLLEPVRDYKARHASTLLVFDAVDFKHLRQRLRTNSMQEKLAALVSLQAIRTALHQQSWKALANKAAEHAFSREGAIIAVRALARQLGINLTKRKALQAIRDNVGADSIFIFGHDARGVLALDQGGYQPLRIYESHERLRAVLDVIAGGRFSPEEPDRYRGIVDALLWGGDRSETSA